MYRFAAELPCLAGVGIAGYFVYLDKPWWLWVPFFLFGCVNIITGKGDK